jgi:hypothetical protein
MIQRAAPARDKGSSHHHVIPLRRGNASPIIGLQASVYAVPQRRQGTRFKLLGILLLAPEILVLSALILVALLGVFVLWLAVVGAMGAGLVISDLIGTLRQVAGALDHRPVPAGQ